MEAVFPNKPTVNGRLSGRGHTAPWQIPSALAVREQFLWVGWSSVSPGGFVMVDDPLAGSPPLCLDFGKPASVGRCQPNHDVGMICGHVPGFTGISVEVVELRPVGNRAGVVGKFGSSGISQWAWVRPRS